MAFIPASRKFKLAAIAYAREKTGVINVERLIVGAHQKPEELYTVIRKRGWRWSVRQQRWIKS